MNEHLTDTLQTLSNIMGPSGHEADVRRALRPMLADYVDEIRIDSMGNLITLKRASEGSRDPHVPRVMVTAHMDEVGLMVVGHAKESWLNIEAIGGVNAHLLPGLHVLVGKARVPGVIGLKAIHKIKSMDKVPTLDKMVVDIGAKNKEEAEKLAPLGTPIVFATQFKDFGPTVAGKAFDDRAGCTILATILQGERLPFDLYGVFTVQEEVGLRGARVAAYTVNPDAAFALEATVADDFPRPEDEDVSPTTELGKGAAVTVMDRSYVTHTRLLSLLLKTAETEHIPYQLKQPGVSATESGVTHAAREGIPAATISVPTRYIHSPIALINREDLENTARLVQATLKHLSPEQLAL